MSEIIEEKLSNGIRVAIDPGSHAGLVSIGFGFEVGTRHEKKEEHGLAHSLEHNAFNGTIKSTSEEIFSRAADMGCFIGAYTSKTETVYNISGSSENAEPMIDILAEIVSDSVFPEEPLEKERRTIIQEIEENNNNPDRVFYDRTLSVQYPDQPLGRTILGTIENISAVRRETIIRFFEQNYNAESMIISVAGEVNPKIIMKQLEERLASFRTGMVPTFERARMADPVYDHISSPERSQTKACLSYKALDALDPDFIALRLGANIVGGGFTSPLFQKVRRENGLVYSISSFASAWVDSGDFKIEFSTTPENMEKAMGIIKDIMNDAAENFDETDLRRAKGVFNTSPRYQYEKVEDRMAGQISQIITFGHVVSLSKYLEEVNAPTLKDVKEVFQKVISTKPTMITMGPKDALSAYDRFTLGLS